MVMATIVPLLLAGACASEKRSATPATPVGRGPSATVVPEGFASVVVVIRRPDGSRCVLCTYLAQTAQERSRGLMGVTDLNGYDGMIFRFDGNEPARFWMKNTAMPLSAVWFAPDGSFLAAVDMNPCASTESSCPSYGPDLPVGHVLELPQGDVDRLRIGTGATLESVGAGCTAGAGVTTSGG